MVVDVNNLGTYICAPRIERIIFKGCSELDISCLPGSSEEMGGIVKYPSLVDAEGSVAEYTS